MNTSTENISYDISEGNKVVIAAERRGGMRRERGGGGRGERGGGEGEGEREAVDRGERGGEYASRFG
jgi:hypothetical protein